IPRPVAHGMPFQYGNVPPRALPKDIAPPDRPPPPEYIVLCPWHAGQAFPILGPCPKVPFPDRGRTSVGRRSHRPWKVRSLPECFPWNREALPGNRCAFRVG